MTRGHERETIYYVFIQCYLSGPIDALVLPKIREIIDGACCNYADSPRHTWSPPGWTLQRYF